MVTVKFGKVRHVAETRVVDELYDPNQAKQRPTAS